MLIIFGLVTTQQTKTRVKLISVSNEANKAEPLMK